MNDDPERDVDLDLTDGGDSATADDRATPVVGLQAIAEPGALGLASIVVAILTVIALPGIAQQLSYQQSIDEDFTSIADMVGPTLLTAAALDIALAVAGMVRLRSTSGPLARILVGAGGLCSLAALAFAIWLATTSPGPVRF